MDYLAHRPGRPLDEVVEYLWALSDAPGHERERIVPSGTLELVINLRSDLFRIFDPVHGHERRFRGAIVSGCYSRAFEFDTRSHALIMGVHFKPGGAARLLDVRPGELADAHVELDALWGQGASQLRERLCIAATMPQRFHLLEQALIARLPAQLHARAAVRAALVELEQPNNTVGRVAKGLGLSRRRFIEIFGEDVGMLPKRYAMVRRFQRALDAALQGPSPAWAQLALAHGYYDQAHLCRDWGELTGVSPAELVKLRGVPVKDGHIALPAEGSNPSKTAARRMSTVK